MSRFTEDEGREESGVWGASRAMGVAWREVWDILLVVGLSSSPVGKERRKVSTTRGLCLVMPERNRQTHTTNKQLIKLRVADLELLQ